MALSKIEDILFVCLGEGIDYHLFFILLDIIFDELLMVFQKAILPFLFDTNCQSVTEIKCFD